MAYITLNKSNFFHNLDIIAKKTSGKDKIALVLKDNAYGHGLLEVAQMAQEYGITKAVVKNEDEAKQIEFFFDYILILADYPTSKNEKFRYTINDIDSIGKFTKGTKVELKIDTGMHRNGISPHEIQMAKEKIKEQGLILEAVFTHHRSADELTSEFFFQNEIFKSIKKEFTKVRFHSCNSAALFRHADFNEDMARIGIAAYGCLDLPSVFDDFHLKPVLSVYASKISSRVVKKGNAIGYGASSIMQDSCTVSNYDFGYGDGFLRTLSNNYSTPKAQKLVGRISMDNSSFISEEKELLIFDDARQIAQNAKTISYEVLTSLKENLKRKIV
ncbi:MAG: alanine racemase [Sulfurimonas sp.]|nr:alanine racemase [Sulfurimonas sp.]